MNAIRINRQTNNLEILSMLFDSVAAKYSCRVRYNPGRRQMQFFGAETCKSHIIEETLSLVALR